MALEEWEPRADGFCAAQICRNGHVITTTAELTAQHGGLEPHCPKCGEDTFVTCPKCHTPIKGRWPPDEHGLMDVPGFTFAHYCPTCGAAYPWTESKTAAAKELIAEMDGLTGEERALLSQDLADLMRDTARTDVAASRFKKLWIKAKGPAKDALGRLAMDLFTATAKGAVGLSP